MKPIVNIVRAGCINYSKGLQLQHLLSKQPIDNPDTFRNSLILLEHEPVYTIGIRTKGYTDEDEIRLRQLGAQFYRTNRGGLITFHGPGQLVAYPIINLQQFKLTMRQYIGRLEQAVIDACRSIGIKDAKTTEDTGIWVGNNKICAIGVHGSRYVTTHGIGLNVCTDLSWFEHIVPCGIEGKGVTSISQELQRNMAVKEAAKAFTKNFSNVFECDVVEGDSQETNNLLRKVEI